MNKKHTFTLLILSHLVFNFAFSQKVVPEYFAPEYSDNFTKDMFAPRLEPGKIFYVSPDGNDDNKGSKKKPFKSLDAARNAIRDLKASKGLPKGGVHVVVMDGVYNLAGMPLMLSDKDAGTAESPIVYRAANSGKTILSAGQDLPIANLKVVTDKETLTRLHSKAQGNVMILALADADVDAYFAGEGKYGYLAMDGYMLQVSQWPNRGYHHIDEIPDVGPTTRWLKPGEEATTYTKENPTGGKFTIKEGLSPAVQREFERSGDMRAQGYFHNDWYFQDEPVGKVTGEVVQLLHHTRYGIKAMIHGMPRRVKLLNVLAELDEPGEWYYDKKEKQLYVWPIKGFDPATSTLTVMGDKAESTNNSFMQPGEDRGQTDASILSLQNSSYVTFRDFIIENTAGLAVEVKGGEYNLLAGNVFRNGAGRGVLIKDGEYNGITGCDFYDLYSAFSISGGDFKSITWCHNFATNNEIHDCRLKGYGAVGLHGVGLYFAHNVLHSMNGAVMFQTVNLLMEYNEYYNIGYEMGDFNVAYCGALWYTMNNVVRHNFVHHLMEPGGHPVIAFRNDDGGVGLKLYGNVFYRSGRGAGQFAGPLNSFQNNITMDCNIMWWSWKCAIEPLEIQKMWDSLDKYGKELPQGDKGDNLYITERVLGKDGWKKSPWLETFPELKKTIETNPFAPTFGMVTKNYISNVSQPIHIHGGDGTVEGMESKELGKFKDLPKQGTFMYPYEIEKDVFVDVEKLDFSFKNDFTPMEGFNPIPFEKIGLVKDEFRSEVDAEKAYRSDVFEQFKTDRDGRYDIEKVNARYPIPEYLK